MKKETILSGVERSEPSGSMRHYYPRLSIISVAVHSTGLEASSRLPSRSTLRYGSSPSSLENRVAGVCVGSSRCHRSNCARTSGENTELPLS